MSPHRNSAMTHVLAWLLSCQSISYSATTSNFKPTILLSHFTSTWCKLRRNTILQPHHIEPVAAAYCTSKNMAVQIFPRAAWLLLLRRSRRRLSPFQKSGQSDRQKLFLGAVRMQLSAAIVGLPVRSILPRRYQIWNWTLPRTWWRLYLAGGFVGNISQVQMPSS